MDGTGASLARRWRFPSERSSTAPRRPSDNRPPRPPKRPKEPKDWRWALGIVGKVFITLGLLILAFVAYQLWGTGIEFRANQRDLASEFRRAVVTTSVASPDTVAASTNDTLPVAEPATTNPSGTDPASTTAAPTTTNPPDRLRNGDVLAALSMPSISKTTYYVVAGVDSGDLKRGVGHYPNTALPGQVGNAAIAGHRTTYGAPFENLDKLRKGDLIIVDTINGGHYEYVVDRKTVINPDQIEVLAPPKDPTAVLLTLTTCHPKRSVSHRLVIHAHLNAETSSAVAPRSDTYAAETPAAPAVTSSTTPRDDTATTVAPAATDAATATSAAAPSTTASTTVPAPTTAPAPTTPDTAVGALAGDDTIDTIDTVGTNGAADAQLTEGWFRDTSAWLQIVLWGIVLIAISLGIHLGGRYFDRRLLAVIGGAIPFLVALYFFFQNINRLLPPGL